MLRRLLPILILCGGPAAPALAQTDAPATAVPLPPPRPEHTVPAERAIPFPPPRPASIVAAAASPPVPQAAAPAAPARSDAEAIARVGAWLNALKVMSGRFEQINADGSRQTGSFHIAKPGRLRFDYDPPSKLRLIADGWAVGIQDRNLRTEERYPIGQTPLRFLLDDRINLAGNPALVGVEREADEIRVTLEETSAIGGTARITLAFTEPRTALTGWTITDAQGYETLVSISELDTATVPPARLFRLENAMSP